MRKKEKKNTKQIRRRTLISLFNAPSFLFSLSLSFFLSFSLFLFICFFFLLFYSLFLFLLFLQEEMRAAGQALTSNLMIAGTVGEETNKVGAAQLRAWLCDRGLVLDELLVAEPTMCQPIHGHKGVCRMHISFNGLAVHSSKVRAEEQRMRRRRTR